MNIIKPVKILSLLTAATIFYGSQALATNGMLPHGTGAVNKGMAGAGVAIPQGAISVANNPAGGTWIKNSFEIGAALFSPRRTTTEFDATPGPAPAGGFVTTGTYESDSDYFVIPYLARNWRLSNRSAFTLAVYAAGGMNTDYPVAPWNGSPAGTGGSGIDLKQLIIAPTYSWKVGDRTSIGVSALIGLQWFEAKGLNAFAGAPNRFADGNPDNLTGKDHDFSSGLGIRLGVMHKISSSFSVGASFTSEVNMSEFDDYSDLFAENGDLDMPANIVVGLAWKPTPTSVLAVDIQRIFYSDVAAIGNSINNLRNCPGFGGADQQSCFGGNNGPGFGWDDMTIIKVGYQWQTSKSMTWRVGISRGDQPVSETTLNILAPAVVQTHVTFGFTKNMSSSSSLTFAAMYAPEKKYRAVSQLANLGIPDDVELKMNQFEVELSWNKRF